MADISKIGSEPQAPAAMAPKRAGPTAAYDLPDDLHIPLHELKADASYLVGRVAADGSASGMIAVVIKTKLSQIEGAALRLNGQRVDVLSAASAMLAAMKALHAEVGKTGWKTAAPIISERNARADLLNAARTAIAAAEAAGIRTEDR